MTLSVNVFRMNKCRKKDIRHKNHEENVYGPDENFRKDEFEQR